MASITYTHVEPTVIYCVLKHTRRHASPTHGSHRQHCTTQLLIHSQCNNMYNCALYYRTALRIILGIYDPLIYQNVIRPHWYTKRDLPPTRIPPNGKNKGSLIYQTGEIGTHFCGTSPYGQLYWVAPPPPPPPPGDAPENVAICIDVHCSL